MTISRSDEIPAEQLPIVQVRVTPRLRQLLVERRIFSQQEAGPRWQDGEWLVMPRATRLEPYVTLFSGRIIPLAMGAFSYSHAPLEAAVTIGRYCSIAAGARLLGADHPHHWATTSPFPYGNKVPPGFDAYLADSNAALDKITFENPRGLVSVGNDVWIAQNALIRRGVTIGDGAVIAAGSLVTSDVPAYAIVGGAPAKVLRMRFDEGVVERMLAAAWWQYGPDVVQRADVRDPERFLDRLAEAVAAGAKPLELTPVTGQEFIDVVTRE